MTCTRIATVSKAPRFTTVDLCWFPQDVPKMPSPFPGMDPYLEAPYIWPDLHNALASELRNELNQSLPNPYYARLEMRPELGITEDRGPSHRIVPDVTVVRRPEPLHEQRAAGTAVLTAPRSVISNFIDYEVSIRSDPSSLRRDPRFDPGTQADHPDRDRQPLKQTPRPGSAKAYERKQREVLESDASLVELDLLPSDGRRILPRSGISKAADP